MYAQSQWPAVAAGAAPVPESLVSANNTFALALLREFNAPAPDQNHFFSPFSIESALSIALEGARGKTAAEMGQALNYPTRLQNAEGWDMNAIRSDFKSMQARFQSEDTPQAKQLRAEVAHLREQLVRANKASQAALGQQDFPLAQKSSREASQIADKINNLAKQVDQYELRNANSLWVDQALPLASQYRKLIEQNYGSAGVFACDFQHQAEKESLRINEWVSEQTREKIKDIIPKGALDALTRLVIANAIYFKGTWSHPFDESLTKPMPFTKSNGQQTTANMMQAHGFEAGKYAAFEADGRLFTTPKMVDEGFAEQQGYPSPQGFQAMELPYNGDQISMMVLLPRQVSGLQSLAESLTAEKLSAVASHLEQRDVHLLMPRFKLESSYGLNDPLKHLGMRQAFNAGGADFSGLVESGKLAEPLYISLVLHKAFVEVNEKGTEAAAATIVAVAARAAPIRQQPFVPTFRADHPFLFVIRDKATGLVLFLGKVESV